MPKVSYKVALGGVVSSLCLLMMFLTAVFPILALALPIFAGILIAVVAIEINNKWGFVTFGAVGALSLVVTPDRTAAIIFIMFFGYYPVLRLVLEERLKKMFLLKSGIKLIVFNCTVIPAFYIISYVFGMMDLVDEFDFLGSNLILGLIVFGNFIFLLYDITTGLLFTTYLKWFRPTFLRKIK